MLAEERMEAIVRLVELRGSVTVQALIEDLEASESTIRRDLTVLSKRGLLIKVHGGALALGSTAVTADADVTIREDLNREDKENAARYAASLVETNDFVYLDAGTTTGLIIDFLSEKHVTFVTNGVMHARKLAGKGYPVYMPGGQLKPVTEAIVGEEALESLNQYHFTKGFFGANGVDEVTGFTTPDIRESKIKQKAMAQCRARYVVCDASKMSKASSVTFAPFEEATVIVAGAVEEKFKTCGHVILV